MPDEPLWLAMLKEFLCRIYREWGGDCGELATDISERIVAVVTTYNDRGAPEFPSEKARSDYLELLTELEGHLDQAGNSLSTEDDASVRALISNLRNEIDPPAS